MSDLPGDSKFAASTFRVSSQTHRPEFFERLFARPPDKSGVKGERKNPRGRSSAILHAHTYLIGSGLESSASLDKHIESLLVKLEPISYLFSEAKRHGELDILLGFGSDNGQGGAVLPAELIKRLSSLGLHVTLDLYPPEATRDS